MQKLKNLFLCLFLFTAVHISAQQSDLVRSYIEQYKDLAIAEMMRTGVPASIKLAQGINETMAGTSDLVMKSNNHFGIKCKSNWTGASVKHNDDERGECFRKYPSSEESYRDHSDFLKGSPRYAFLFDLDPTDYAGWAWGLKKAGYATNPRYALSLIKTIEDYGLQEYTLIALGKQKERPADGTVLTEASSPITNTPTASPGEVPGTKKEMVREEVAEQAPAYPKGQFKINETKVVYVPKGTSYLAIAKEYNVDLAKLFEFNDMPQAEEVDRDRLIYLQRKRKTGNNEYHVVKPGETLHDIAQAEAIRIESLMELNWLRDGEMPAIGEQLNLLKKSSATPRLALNTNYSLLPQAPVRATN